MIPAKKSCMSHLYFGLVLSILLCCWGLVGTASGADEWIELSRDLNAFREPTGEWFVAGGAKMDSKNERRLLGEPGSGVLINGKEGRTENLVTKEEWGDVEVSLEFLIPAKSNSGIKLQGVYEIQITDTWKDAKLAGDSCGGIYPRAERKPRYHHIDEGIAPKTNAAKAPGEWSTLDIVFRAPRFDEKGKKTANAQFEKVVLNGTPIHDHVEVAHPTGHVWREPEHATGPLFLQADHGPVAFRNVRLRPIGPQRSE